MRFVFLLLAIVGTSFAAPTPVDLDDDLQDLLALIPVDKIKDIFDDHLANDGAVAAVVDYLQGPEWADLVDSVLSKPAVVDFIAYLTDAGLPVADIIAEIHNAIAGATPGVDASDEASLRSFLDDVEDILPVDKIVALLNDKLQNSEAVQDLYEEISSEEAHALVEEVREIEEVQRLAQRLREMGVEVDEALAIVYDFLGWGEPKKTIS